MTPVHFHMGFAYVSLKCPVWSLYHAVIFFPAKTQKSPVHKGTGLRLKRNNKDKHDTNTTRTTTILWFNIKDV